jgi:hypothetical protein
MPTIERRWRHETGVFPTANHFDERKHAGHGERVRRLEWRVSVACRWCLSGNVQWSSSPTSGTRPTRHVRLRWTRGWSARCIETCSHPTAIPSTRQLLVICLHLARPSIPGGAPAVIFTTCATSRRRRERFCAAWNRRLATNCHTTDISASPRNHGAALPTPLLRQPRKGLGEWHFNEEE